MKKIIIAHSPDADDIFMYYAIKFGWVSTFSKDQNSFIFENIADDIQTLNNAALKGLYDVCAISFACYPLLFESSALLRTAASFGLGYGPKLIKKKGSILKRNFKVALSGEHTSNALLFSLAYPDARISFYNFLEIENAVLRGEVDAGVLIHESILNFSQELEVEREIWDIWAEFCEKFSKDFYNKSSVDSIESSVNKNLDSIESKTQNILPLPLGGMCIRRSLPLVNAIKIEKILTNAVRVAVENKALLSKMLLERNLVRVNSADLNIYLNLYANADSVELSEIQLAALNLLFKLGYDSGKFSTILDAHQCLIPREYEDLRYC